MSLNLRTRPTNILILTAVLGTILLMMLSFGCAGSPLTRAYNTMGSVTELYNRLPPVYDAIDPQYDPQIVQFDIALNRAIKGGWSALIAWKAGTGSELDFRLAVRAIIGVLEEQGVNIPPIIEPIASAIRNVLLIETEVQP